MATGVARVLKWHRMQRDLVELHMSNWRDQLEKCHASLRQVEEWLEAAVGNVDPQSTGLHVLSALQQRIVLDDQCQQWRARERKIQHELTKLLEERNRIRLEMRKYEALLEEEKLRRNRQETMKLERQLDDFVLRQWDRGYKDSEVEPC